MAIKKQVLMGDAGLGFVFGKLQLRYRGSDKPQRLTIDAKYDLAEVRQGRLDQIVEAIARLGVAGGEHFAPEVGKAKPIKGDFGYTLKQPLARKKTLHAELQVAGVSPKWMRSIVEYLRAGCLEMKVTGELGPDDTPLSCTERDIQAWVPSGEEAAYPGLWEPVPFEVERGDLKKGCVLHLDFEGPLDPATCTKKFGMDWRMTAIGSQAAHLLSADQGHAGVVSLVPKLVRGALALTTTWEVFDVSREPARALLLNAVTRIHRSVQPVKRVSLKL
ncbi:MAG: hypothetical protein U0414_25070 [Polyangiaceae bacterium]